jgi:hypothetical protein
MNGTVGITDHGWYEFLLAQSGLDEVNFWTPSAHWAFRGDVGSPFFFKAQGAAWPRHLRVRVLRPVYALA